MENPTALFDSYEQDFQQVMEMIRHQLDSYGKDERFEQRKATSRQVQMELDEADEMVSQMEIEVQGIPQSIKPQYYDRLRAAKANLSRYKNDSKELHSQIVRSDLLSSSEPSSGSFTTFDEPYGVSSDRTRLLTGTSLLEDGTKRLQESQRIALETEDQGAGILTNLREQREQIENARNILQTADTSISRASDTLKKMIRRMYQQRAVTGGIIFILVLLLGTVIWEKLGFIRPWGRLEVRSAWHGKEIDV